MKGNKIWVEVRTDDNCMWQLKGRVWEKEPTLDEIQDVVGGHYQPMPRSLIPKDIKKMLVNENGHWEKLPVNELATLNTTMLNNHPVVGNVLMQIDEYMIRKEYWLQ
jgi:hypothetical protein